MPGVLSGCAMTRTLLLTLGVLLPVPLAAEPLAEPPVIASAGGSLGLLVVAREQRLVGLPGQPVGWVYEICRYRASEGPRRRCPSPGTKIGRASCRERV